jgi:hypothetical protein
MDSALVCWESQALPDNDEHINAFLCRMITILTT